MCKFNCSDQNLSFMTEKFGPKNIFDRKIKFQDGKVKFLIRKLRLLTDEVQFVQKFVFAAKS